MKEDDVKRDLFCPRCGCYLAKSLLWDEIRKLAETHEQENPGHRLYAPAVKQEAVDIIL